MRARGLGARLALMAVAAALVTGCAFVPKSGPTSSAIDDAAVDPAATVVPFAYSIITPDTLKALSVKYIAPEEDLSDAGPNQGQVLRVGDVVGVTIWEAVEGGLFSGVAASNKSATLPKQRIGRSGMISVPYAGRVRAAGRTPESVADAVAGALEGKAIEPQVLVTVEESPVSAVTVIGDAAEKSGRAELAGVGERVLDVIAAAGGSSVPTHRTLVRLTRDGRQAETHLSRILREPAQNVRVQAGDVISLLDNGSSYVVLGATRRPQRLPFSTEVVTLDEALAEAGGLQDNLADPGAVYIFRYESSDVVAALTGKPQGPEPTEPLVYNLDLTDPGSFFLASRFEMEDGDILYTANAPLANALKVISAAAFVLNPVTNSLRLLNQIND